MTSLFRVVMTIAFVAAAAGVHAQEPALPLEDPTRPEVVEPADGRLLRDVPLPARLRQEPPQEPPERFRPLDELPPEEQFPAAPLLVAAYAFVMLAFFGYVLSVAKRLGLVQREIDRLERDLKKSGRT